MASEILILNPVSREVSSVGFGDSGDGKSKWSGFVEFGRLLYICPFHASEILTLDHVSSWVTCGGLVDEGVGERKWPGVVECDSLRYFSPCQATEVMVLDPVAQEVRDFVRLADAGQGDW